jgi:hypothetical protein
LNLGLSLPSDDDDADDDDNDNNNNNNNNNNNVKTSTVQSVQLLCHWLGEMGSNVGRDKKFFSYLKSPDQLWVPSRFLSNGYRASSPGMKRSALDFDHSPPPDSEFKK